MSSRTLFSALRGKDGRSLARALIVLVLVSLFAGGLNTGATADDGGTAYCASAGASDSPEAPRRHEPDCCMTGATPFGLALAAAPPVLARQTYILRVGLLPVSGAVLDSMGGFRATARGPPAGA
ncbi:MAG TPA: hypothetical protein VFK86_02820 [Bauldia sp.]|nr:hypothetical protein [Bauldia sp.]